MAVNGSLIKLNSIGEDIPVYYVVGTNENATSSRDDYDAEGAMQFIICTVAVYSTLGIVCMLLSGIKKNSNPETSKLQDDEVSKYLKQQRLLNLEGYHTQLRSQCEKYSEKIRLYEEKVRLLEIGQEIQTEDFGLTQFTNKQKKLSKKERKKKNKKVSNTSSALGKLGFSLLYLPDRNVAGSRSDIEEPSVNQLDVIVEQNVLEVTTLDEICAENNKDISVEKTESKTFFLERQRSISV